MANIVTPQDIPLPEFLDYILSFLSDILPPPVYSILISVLSNSLALLSTLLTLLFDSSNWNAQTLLPPIIALLTAYLAIISLYRTTSWLLRTSFWFIKWGTILAAVAAGTGYLLGNEGAMVTSRGVANTAAGFILDALNGDQSNAARSAQSSSSRRKRPQAWKSFKDHNEWQYRERQAGDGSNDNARILIDSVVASATSLIQESNWWGFFDGTGEDKDKGSEKGKGKGKGKEKESGSVSR
ncbi:hypothetical protein C8R42DRAFT_684966 [Lentinula raphanica]|nr:hypothetical protein C8R42DRAFT_684966 [Lentinula raphanica]